MTTLEAYEQLTALGRNTAFMGSAIAALHWDQSVMMPKGGAAHRAGTFSALAGIRHKMITDPQIGELIARVEGSDLVSDPLSVEAVNVREFRRMYDRISKIPHKLAVELSYAAAHSQSVWEKARPADDWLTFAPHLERLVQLKREEALCIGYDGEPYDALLDGFEPGETAESVRVVFEKLRPELLALLDRIRGAAYPELPAIGTHFPLRMQKEFGITVAKRIGYDFDGGRLDISAHPFTSGIGPGDVRITTRYDENDFTSSFFGIVHEAGHALYHQGLPNEYWGEPFCSPSSLGINESQSRFWENQTARSFSFWKYFFPIAVEKFDLPSSVTPENFYAHINRVHPGLIRVEADEVTYNLHVLLRFELETALMDGSLPVSDLPGAWNEKMRDYLGVVPDSHKDGAMQDIHWSGGMIGYFPTYTLGNIYAAQLLHALNSELGNVDELCEAGEFAEILEWLRCHIHREGRRRLPRDLIRNVCGEDPNPMRLMEYLNAKYGVIYGF